MTTASIPTWARTILTRIFRANPTLELVLFDRLPAADRQLLEPLRQDPAFYGILRPRHVGAEAGSTGGAAGGPSIRAVDRETALLFLTLSEPGPLPGYVTTVFGTEAGPAMARLVADGVLEVGSGDRFVSGAAAMAGAGTAAGGASSQGPSRAADDFPAEEFCPGDGAASRGRLAALSIAALRYGQALAIDDPVALSIKLYRYHSRPLTPEWKRRLADEATVRGFLGIDAGGPNRVGLEVGWMPIAPAPGWLRFKARRVKDLAGGAEMGGRDRAPWKLYVSPALEALPDCFGLLCEALARAGATQFKVGADAWGLLRSDRIVAYFPTFEGLAGAAERLTGALEGLPAQGVPFTSEIGLDGLLSWGVDPPKSAGEMPWSGSESWRFWLTHRLAAALLSARGSSPAPPMEPWRFALERLRLEGVDTDTWTPGGRWNPCP